MAKRSVLLPRRLADRVPLVEPRESAASVTSGQDTWGLAERIGSLPGVTSTCLVLPDGTTATDYFIEALYVLRSACSNSLLICHIDNDGVLLPQIGPIDRAEVIKKGWASRDEDSLTLFLPRDTIEMEIAWRIILLAYQYLTSKPVKSRRKSKIKPILPKYSSTAKYWM